MIGMADTEDTTNRSWGWTATPDQPTVDLRTDRPHTARIYDYFLGGKDNFPADREAAEQAIAVYPNASATALANRAFMTRVVRHLTADVGVRQFLDVGTGIPTSPNLHEVAQSVAADARVVYVDNDRCKSGCTHRCRSGPRLLGAG
jgi:S-adenosyl methyltransferase